MESAHQDEIDAPTKVLSIDQLKEFIDEMGSKVYNNLCYPG